MSNKLQELTDRLYAEGLSKGKEEGEALLAKAQKEASELISSAKAQAEQIIADAKKSASEIQAKAESDIRMASAQSLQATRKSLEELLSGAICSEQVSALSQDSGFIKSIITELVAKFSPDEELRLTLSESLKSELESWASGQLASKLKAGISVEWSKKLRGGFTVGPKDGSYYISFSDESFQALIAEYLRPVTAKILFA